MIPNKWREWAPYNKQTFFFHFGLGGIFTLKYLAAFYVSFHSYETVGLYLKIVVFECESSTYKVPDRFIETALHES